MTDLFDFKAISNHFAVIGNPVAHSKSPQIHQLFALQFGIVLQYDRIQVDIGGFDQAVSHFAAHGGAGLNVTVPFKVDAWQLCSNPGNHLSARAQCAQAVNTLRFDRDPAGSGQTVTGPSVIGDNTDGFGMIRDIENNLDFSIAGKRVLVLGAGGAVRGILGPLADCKPASITISNRTAQKARALAEKFGAEKFVCGITGCGYDRVNEPAFDLIINGTAASMDGQLPGISSHCLSADSVVYDMMYAAQPTLFMNWALAHGATKVSDGLGMLVEQAAESFYLWHDRRPDTTPVIDVLRKT